AREQVADAAAQRLAHDRRVLRRQRQDVVHLLDHAGRLVVVAALDGGTAGDRVLRRTVGAVDAGELEPAGVEDGDVPAGAQGDADVLADAVELLAGRQPALAQL